MFDFVRVCRKCLVAVSPRSSAAAALCTGLARLAAVFVLACSGPSGKRAVDGSGDGDVIGGDAGEVIDQVTADDAEDVITDGSDPAEFEEGAVIGQVVVNEILAKDTNLGPDWAELYNTGDTPIDISGFKLVDNITKPPEQYFIFPQGTVVAGHSYVVVDCDGGLVGDGYHAPFKFKTVESLYWMQPDGTVLEQVDFTGLDLGLSYSRIPDGTGDFKIVTTPTRGTSNHE